MSLQTKNIKLLKPLIILVISIIVFIFLLFLFRQSILSSLANFLIVENNNNKTQVCFVLSGNAFDRGNKAIEMYNNHFVTHFYCTGENMANDLKAIGIYKSEAALQKDYLIRKGVPDSLITIISRGTSSYEEINCIDSFCTAQKINACYILTSKFHTKRIFSLLKEKKSPTSYAMIGASSSNFNEANWWKNEYGLIALNNEYVKLLYYKLKY